MTNQKSDLDIKYESYLNSSDKTKIINGKIYYKAVNICILTIGNEKCYELCLDKEMFGRGKIECIQDEWGNVLKLSPPAFCSFGGNIPEWYRNCGLFLIKRSEIKGTIGKFFTVIEQ